MDRLAGHWALISVKQMLSDRNNNIAAMSFNKRCENRFHTALTCPGDFFNSPINVRLYRASNLTASQNMGFMCVLLLTVFKYAFAGPRPPIAEEKNRCQASASQRKWLPDQFTRLVKICESSKDAKWHCLHRTGEMHQNVKSPVKKIDVVWGKKESILNALN